MPCRGHCETLTRPRQIDKGAVALTHATLIGFIGYLLVLFAIGLVAWQRTTSISDYALGGRSLGPAVTALSAGASDMSGWLLLGLPGAIYARGLAEAWLVAGLLAGAWANWYFVAPRLRAASGHFQQALSLPELLSSLLQRDAQSANGALRIVATVIVLVFFTFYVAAGLVAGARLFESSFDFSYQSALLLGAAIIAAYTMAGGFLAVSWTDFFQACLMLVALVAVPALLLATDSNALQPTTDWLPAATQLSVIGWLSLVAWGLGYFGQPHILMRFMAIREPGRLPVARRIGMSWMLVTGVAAITTGLAGRHLFGGGLETPETVFIELTQLLFNPWVAGIVLAAILAAVMSTIDSQLLVASTSLAEDVYKPLLAPNADNRALMRVGRLAVLLVAGVAFAMAREPDSTVLALVGHAWAGLGASFGPVLLLALYWPRLTARGAVCGMSTGALTVLVWSALEGGLFELYELLPAFLLALLVAAAASFWNQPLRRGSGTMLSDSRM